MKIKKLDELEKAMVAMEGAKHVWKQVPISKKDGSPAFSFRVFTIEPNGHTPYHTHPFEHLNFIIDGHGVMVNEKNEEREISAGDFAIVFPDEKHQYKNKSEKEPLVMICAVPSEYE